ncbi:MAG TPA: Gmad2 immunoglobulin-like domain-containing protein [Candidatus Limnocylindrales bacterium]|nr:Gmad2 immunoglobulin-like domain-containing protein [Candidatus Limnocylindrales bacterium]
MAAGLGLALSVALAACGSGDNQTVFILPSTTPSPSASTVPVTGSASPSAGTSATPNGVAATPIPDGSHIIIDSPNASTAISSPIEVSGAASVLNGTVVAVVLDSAGNELGRAQTTASASAPDFGHYDVQVTFSGAQSGAKGQVKVYGVRADGTTPTYYYYIIVRFA